jgi:hypothetical protein
LRMEGCHEAQVQDEKYQQELARYTPLHQHSAHGLPPFRHSTSPLPQLLIMCLQELTLLLILPPTAHKELHLCLEVQQVLQSKGSPTL